MDHLDKQTRLALRLRSLSLKRWGAHGEIVLLGRHPGFRDAQKRLLQFSRIDRPLLITGESGVGKEAFARALYLLSDRTDRKFLSVNCAQFQSEELLVSELFGHKKGAFTGATSDRVGLFEQADGGVVFLDEVGELPMKAQAMLLRALGEGEISPLGETEPRYVDVRIVAATNRDLAQMVEERRFRQDLFFRLCYLQLQVPPLRERGGDWRIILDDYLEDLNHEHGESRAMSDEARKVLSTYHWPGNVRELRGIADVGFALCMNGSILPENFGHQLQAAPKGKAWTTGPLAHYRRMEAGEGNFWTVIREPYLDRDLNRGEVRHVVAEGLRSTRGSYKKLLGIFGIDDGDYLKFMDFLRHHRLKPERK